MTQPHSTILFPQPPIIVDALWLARFDSIPERNLPEILDRWDGSLYVKSLEGTRWMCDVDRSPFAVWHQAGAEPQWNWRERGWIPWVAPEGRDPWSEGGLAGQLAHEAGAVVVDLRDWPHVCDPRELNAQRFLRTYAQETSVRPRIAVDLDSFMRGYSPSFVEAADCVLTHLDNRTLEAWRWLIGRARTRLDALDKRLEAVMPGDADADQLGRTLAWCQERGLRVSLRSWQTINAENWPCGTHTNRATSGRS